MVTYRHSRIRDSLARREMLRKSGTKNAQVGGVDTLCKQFPTSFGVPLWWWFKEASAKGEQSLRVITHFSLVTSGTMTYSSNGSKKIAFSFAYGECQMLSRQLLWTTPIMIEKTTYELD
jgi:hypothetical protein